VCRDASTAAALAALGLTQPAIQVVGNDLEDNGGHCDYEVMLKMVYPEHDKGKK
jgi:hypothetical protein